MSAFRPHPSAFAAGLAAGLLLCSIAGRYYAGRNIFDTGLQRFHRKISPETNFFPTPNQLLHFTEARSREDQTLVIVGGSSIMNGVSQRVEQLWSVHLQRLLGDRYAVVNLSTRGGAPHEHGNWVGEMLLQRKRRLVYVSDVLPCPLLPQHMTGLRWREFFWSARVRGMLLPDWPERAKALAGLPDENGASPERIKAYADLALNFDDLWTSISYLHFSSFFHFLTSPNSFGPRNRFRDDDLPAAPGMERYKHLDRAHEVKLLEAYAKPCVGARRAAIEADLRASISPAVFHRMVALLIARSPYLTRELSPGLRATYDETKRDTAKFLESQGAIAPILDDWDDLDFSDPVHLSELGGAKLAALVADIVRERAR